MQRDSQWRARIQWVGLVAGPLLAAVCFLLLPLSYLAASGEVVVFAAEGRVTLSVMVWMATWWLTEAIPISATALLPLVLFPLLGVTTIEKAAAPYAHPLIFLFFGGFVLALAMQRWGLGKRAALTTLQVVGTRPIAMVAGFMAITAVFSAFVSNTATTAMMLPIALSVIQLVETSQRLDSATGNSEPGDSDNFARCLLLGIAYSASVGGIATIIGTPPNAVLVGFVNDKIAAPHRMEISFAGWMKIGVPLVVVFLPIVFVLLTKVLAPVRIGAIEGGKQLIRGQLEALGPKSRGEVATSVVFVLTAVLWIVRPLLARLTWETGGGSVHPFANLTDAGIAMTAALALFVIPVDFKTREFVMDWRATQQLPWGILILFGGGLSLAGTMLSSGAAEFIASQTSYLAGMPDIVLVIVVAAGMTFLTELTSNTATTATLVPILAAMAPGLGVHPYLLIFPAAIAASCAFMLPVATPPNAIVFGSGRITIPDMARTGLCLNILGIVLVTLLTAFVIGPAMGVDLWDG